MFGYILFIFIRLFASETGGKGIVFLIVGSQTWDL